MKKRIFALLLCLVCALSLGGCQPEQIDYDTSPLSFGTVFDDTLGNPDKPEDFAFHDSHHPPAYRVRTYDFEEDTICKGAFYVLPPEYSYDLEDTPPEKGIIKGKTVNGKLCIDPQGNATRAEAATMMKNYLG